MPTNKQRREAARRHLERQLERRQERDAARKRFTLIASIVGTIVVVAIIAVFIVAVSNDNKKKTPAAASPTPSSTASSTFVAQKTSGPCGYTTANPAGNPNLKSVGMPPDPAPTPRKNLTVDFQTNRGLIEVTLTGDTAPCNVQSLAYLIQRKFFDKTPCPRVVNSGIYVVQCGSGGATTSGGPTYTVPDENLAKANYTAGAIAMANIGQANTASSQFFFITKDSSKGLQKSYTVVGHVTKGLSILQKVAAGGDDGSSGQVGGGKPKLALTFTSVKIVKVAGGGPTPGLGSRPTLVPVTK